MTQQQAVDKNGFAILKTKNRTVYSTIDQHKDGNAHPKGHKNRGPFFNRDAEVELTPFARAILENQNK